MILLCVNRSSSYHVWANLGTGAKHQFTLPVGIVDLTREEGGQLVWSAYGLIKEALPIASAKNSKNVCKNIIYTHSHTHREDKP